MISVKHLKKSFGTLNVLLDVNAEIPKGETVSIIGPSGTGKSTFLRCLNLLEKADSGEIWVDGRNILTPETNVNRLRMKMGMVFQQFNLFSHLTIAENIMLGPQKLLKMPKEQAQREALDFLKLVGLADKYNTYPDKLSGGQKQRAAIARTLAMHPEIILFDEPTSSLDPTMVSEVLGVIRRLANDKMTMLIVTHEMKFARDVSDRVLYMDEGTIYEEGTPEEIFQKPQKPKTYSFVHKIRTSEYRIKSADFDRYELNSVVTAFASKHFLSRAQMQNLETLTEKLVSDCIIKLSSDILVSVSYSDETSAVELKVEYGGAPCNVFTAGSSAEDLIKAIDSLAAQKSYTYETGRNTVSAVLK